MNIDCNNIDDLLLEGDALSMQYAAQHARGCRSCAGKLDDWIEISDTARTLQAGWPSDTLWPRINRLLRAERRRQIVHSTWQIAAAVVLTVGLGAGSWVAVQHSKKSAFEREILNVSALDDVERAERAHIAAIDRLEKVADPKLESASSPLMVVYKEKLMLLDDAIADCQTNIDRNHQNAHLRRQLLTIYSEKQRTLEAVMREGSYVSNQ